MIFRAHPRGLPSKNEHLTVWIKLIRITASNNEHLTVWIKLIRITASKNKHLIAKLITASKNE